MLDYNKGDLSLTCDQCEEEADFIDCGDFLEGVAESKKEGWIHRRSAGDFWLHFCSSTCDDYHKSQAAKEMFQDDNVKRGEE